MPDEPIKFGPDEPYQGEGPKALEILTPAKAQRDMVDLLAMLPFPGAKMAAGAPVIAGVSKFVKPDRIARLIEKTSDLASTLAKSNAYVSERQMAVLKKSLLSDAKIKQQAAILLDMESDLRKNMLKKSSSTISQFERGLPFDWQQNPLTDAYLKELAAFQNDIMKRTTAIGEANKAATLKEIQNINRRSRAGITGVIEGGKPPEKP